MGLTSAGTTSVTGVVDGSRDGIGVSVEGGSSHTEAGMSLTTGSTHEAGAFSPVCVSIAGTPGISGMMASDGMTGVGSPEIGSAGSRSGMISPETIGIVGSAGITDGDFGGGVFVCPEAAPFTMRATQLKRSGRLAGCSISIVNP